MADDILDIADDGTNDFIERQEGFEVVNSENIQRSRLRVDTRKWFMSKVLPKFKDKQEEQNESSLSESISKLIDKLPN